MRNSIKAGVVAACAGMATGAMGQVAPQTSHEVTWKADSGKVQAPAKGGAAVVYETTVFVPRAPWLRLGFGAVELGGALEHGTGAQLRLTSLLDGAVQVLNAESAAQWSNTSAYFNGDAVHVQLIAYPGTGPSRVSVASVTVGESPNGSFDSLCGADDRVLSFDNRQARHSTGCTSWMINDTNRQFLTAGHCGTVNTSVMSFNVPLSTAAGALVASNPNDQYPVSAGSIQSNGGLGIGDDWCYFGVSPNSNTGLMPAQAYGMWYTLMIPPAMGAGQIVRITGYGTTSSPITPTWNQVQKTHTGARVNPTTGVIATTVSYQTDTTGGNSGSPVILESSGGVAIGIHTHAGCSTTAGNNGTALQHAALQAALNAPTGACLTGRGTPSGDLYVIGDAANNFGTLNTTTGAFAKKDFAPPRMEGLAYNRNGGFFYAVSNDTFGVAPGAAGRKLWQINPATGAATYIANISGAAGVINGLGYNAAANVLYGVIAATGTRVVINTTTGVATVDGANNGGSISGVEFDDTSGLLYGIEDVVGGGSRLVFFTPATGSVTVVGNLGAGATDCNGLAITADGQLWTINAATDQLLRINKATGAATLVGATSGLFGASFGMSAVLPPLSNPCYANCDGSTTPPILNVQDFSCFLNSFAAGESYANCDGSTTVPVLNVQDFSCFLNAFAAGCS